MYWLSPNAHNIQVAAGNQNRKRMKGIESLGPVVISPSSTLRGQTIVATRPTMHTLGSGDVYGSRGRAQLPVSRAKPVTLAFVTKASRRLTQPTLAHQESTTIAVTMIPFLLTIALSSISDYYLAPHPLSRRVAPSEFGLPNFSLSSADKSHLWLASLDLLALCAFIWQTVSEYSGGATGLADARDVATTARLCQTELPPRRFGIDTHPHPHGPLSIIRSQTLDDMGPNTAPRLDVFRASSLASLPIRPLLPSWAPLPSVAWSTLVVIKHNLAALNEPTDSWPPVKEVEEKPRPSFATEDVDGLREGTSWLTSDAGSSPHETLLPPVGHSRPPTPALSSAKVLSGYGYTADPEKSITSLAITGGEVDISNSGYVLWILSIWIQFAGVLSICCRARHSIIFSLTTGARRKGRSGIIQLQGMTKTHSGSITGRGMKYQTHPGDIGSKRRKTRSSSVPACPNESAVKITRMHWYRQRPWVAREYPAIRPSPIPALSDIPSLASRTVLRATLTMTTSQLNLRQRTDSTGLVRATRGPP
ncbi:hypothetical protein OG21DRAFT_1571035 [Imleria badia]|nr:hypothetical protein OG21DRAFT_1571035 [Imleria badia]